MTEPQAEALKILFIPMQDYPKDIEDETNQWFDTDHVPLRLSCAGFLGCERYQLSSVEPAGWSPATLWTKYLNVYYVESPAVLATEAYRQNAAHSSNSWRDRRQAQYLAAGKGALPHTARSIRTLWRQRTSPWTRPTYLDQPPPRTLYVVLSDVEAGYEDAFNAFMDEEAVPELLGSPGFLRAERYESAELTSGRLPAERQPMFMDVFDVTTPEVLSGNTFRVQYGTPSPRAKELARHVTVRGRGVYIQRPSPWAAVPVGVPGLAS
jgi:hypothetical protein